MRAELHDGRVLEFPDGTDPAVVQATVRKVLGIGAPKGPNPAVAAQDAALRREADMGKMVQSEVLGALSPARGLMDIADTVREGFSFARDKLTGSDTYKGVKAQNDADSKAFEDATQFSPMVAGTGRFAGQLGGTAPVGAAIAAPLKTVAPALSRSIATGGMSTGRTATGVAGKAADLATRSAGSAITGGASAGLVDPEFAKTGAMVGAATPVVLRGVGGAMHAAGRAVRGSSVSPEVAALAQRAKELGIDIPADRIGQSKPMDAIASGLNYMPFSGRAGAEARMNEQLNRAASRLMGQDNTNINKAIRDASIDLGNKFDDALRGNYIKFDQQLLQEAADVFNTAQRELGGDALKPIAGQIDELFEKGANGVIEGQAAYNIKRTLDRIGRRNSPEAYHALELKRVIMGALDRSLGPDKAKAFAKTREQYGNMLALEKLAKNGVEGELSVARLANMKNINNEPLQELADIAAQFVKTREGQHGAMQRAVVGMTGASLGGPVGLAAGVGVGRAANAALNSNAARNFMLGRSGGQGSAGLGLLGYRGAPLLTDDQ